MCGSWHNLNGIRKVFVSPFTNIQSFSHITPIQEGALLIACALETSAK